MGSGGYKPIVNKKTDSNKPQPKWYKWRNPSNRKERCGQSRQPAPCSTTNQISLFLLRKKDSEINIEHLEIEKKETCTPYLINACPTKPHNLIKKQECGQ